jgi:hypothetical protein
MAIYTKPTPYKYGNITITTGGHGGGGTGYANGVGTYYTNSVPMQSNPGKVVIASDAVFEGNITWQDRDMRAWFESVESRLAILQPNVKLEAEYEELAELGRQYKEMEKKLLEKQRVFDILKNPVD